MKKILILLAVFFLSSFSAAQKKAFTIEDLYKIKNLASPKISEDGKYLTFTVTEYFLEEGKSNSDVYYGELASGKFSKILSSDKNEFDPIWKGSEGIYFISDKNENTQLYYFDLKTEDTSRITDFYSGINSPKFSDNGEFIFSSKVFPECGADENCNKELDNAIAEGPIQAHIADSLLFRHWTHYNIGKYSHIFLAGADSAKYEDVTPGEYNSPTFSAGSGGEYDISPDGSKIVFMSKRVKDPAFSTNSDIFLYDVSNGEIKNLTKENEAWDGDPKFSSDGKFIAYKMQRVPGNESDQIRLAVYDLKSGKSKVLTEDFDYWVNDFEWDENSGEIFFTALVKGYLPLYKINLDSEKISEVISEKVIAQFDLSNDKIIYSASSVGEPTELYSFDLKNSSIQKLTFFNEEIAQNADVRPAEELWIKGADGKPVHTFLVKPHDFDSTKKYPLILNVHGGPQYQWMNSFRGDWQVYPGAGYIVAFPNPHGSAGYGQDYTEAISGDWGGKVYEDLMLVTDSLETLPYVDTNRIGAMGWSFGGYMMNFFQAKTNRFNCLVSMMGIYDLKSFFGTTEELWFPKKDLEGTPWETGAYEKYSPSNYVEDFSTPTLIITGEKDYRISYVQSVEYFTVLQMQGIDSRLIIFENDGHWPSHIKSMPLYYNAHLDWFHKYLGGKPAPYDMKKLLRNLQFKN